MIQDPTKTLISNKIYAYDFSNDDYELIGETPDTPLGDHACIALQNDQDQKVEKLLQVPLDNI